MKSFFKFFKKRSRKDIEKKHDEEMVSDSVESESCSICTNAISEKRDCNKCTFKTCKKCIEEWYKTARKTTCPQCREQNTYTDVIIPMLASPFANQNSVPTEFDILHPVDGRHSSRSELLIAELLHGLDRGARVHQFYHQHH